MRQQTIRLNKTPSTEVQAGVLSSGVTQTPSMPFVQIQKTKGQRMAETFGMAVDAITTVATKGAELYKGQKDEEALNQFATDKFRFLEELNAQESPADKQLLMQNKMQELSQPGVNVKYRNAFVNSFSGTYNKILGQVKEQGYLAQENLMFKEMTIGIKEGLSYEQMTAKYSSVLPKERWHKVYAAAILSNAQFDANPNNIQTPEDLEAFKNEYKTVIANYNANPYAGGSKSITATEIKTKLLGDIDKLTTSFDDKFKEEYQVQKAIVERDLTMTPKAFEKYITSSKYQDPSDAIKAVEAYKKDYEEAVKLNTLKNNFDVHSPMNNTNYTLLSDKEKRIVDEQVAKNITYGLETGAYTSLVTTVTGNIKSSDKLIKNFFNTATTNKEMLNKQLTAYSNLKKTRNGNMVLNGLNKIDRTTLEILSVYPESDVESIREILNSDLKEVNQFGDRNKYRKDWNKVLSKLSVKDREIADSLRVYAYNTNGMDAKAAIEFVEDNFMETASKKLSGNVILGRVTEEEAEKDLTDIELVYEGFDYDTIEYTDDGGIVVSNSENPMVKSRVTRDYIQKAAGTFRGLEQINKKVDEAAAGVLSLTEGEGGDIITEVKEGIKDMFKANSDIIGTLETEGTTPDVITEIKDRFKSWSNRVNGTDFKLSTDEGYDDATKEVDDVVDTIIDAVGPTKAGADDSIGIVDASISEMQKEARKEIGNVTIEDMRNAITKKPNSNTVSFNLGNSAADRKAFVNSNKGNFSSKTERASFMAQVYQESKGIPQEENLNYSQKTITKVFSKSRLQGKSLSQLARNPEELANTVYGGAWGRKNLGNTNPGDGWKFRGRGLIQITGRANYEYFGKLLNIDLVNNPDLANKPDIAYKIAEAYWDKRVRPKVKDFTDIKSVTKAVNGGTHGLKEREKYFNIYNK